MCHRNFLHKDEAALLEFLKMDVKILMKKMMTRLSFELLFFLWARFFFQYTALKDFHTSLQIYITTSNLINNEEKKRNKKNVCVCYLHLFFFLTNLAGQ